MDRYVALAIMLAYTGVIVLACYAIWGRQSDAVVEGYAPQRDMGDGSVILSREPDGKPSVPAPATVPGHKVIRTIDATVSGGKPIRVSDHRVPDNRGSTNQPPAGQIATVQECLTVADFTCPPVTVRVDLLRAKDGTMRAQVSSSTGEVLDGVDIPREPTLVPKRLPWAVGYQRDLDGVQGIYLTRDIGRLEVGASITQDATAQARIGWRF